MLESVIQATGKQATSGPRARGFLRNPAIFHLIAVPILVVAALLTPALVLAADECYTNSTPTAALITGDIAWSEDTAFNGGVHNSTNPTYKSFTIEYLYYHDIDLTQYWGGTYQTCDNASTCSLGIYGWWTDPNAPSYWSVQVYDDSRTSNIFNLGLVTVATGGDFGCFLADVVSRENNTSLQFSAQYLNINGVWVNIGTVAGAFSVTSTDSMVETTQTVSFGSGVYTVDYTQLDPSATVTINFDGPFTDPGGIPFTMEPAVSVTSVKDQANTLSRTGLPDSQPAGSVRLYTIDFGWSNTNGEPIERPEIPMTGGWYPYYYAFDGLQCQSGSVTIDQINSNTGLNMDWTNPQFSAEYPLSVSTGYLSSGVVQIWVNPYLLGQTPFLRGIASCTTDTGEITREGGAVGQDVGNGTPCDNMELTDPDSWLQCLIYRLKTDVMDPLFVPKAGTFIAFETLKTEAGTKFPFSLMSGALDQVNAVVGILGISRSSCPTFTLTGLDGIQLNIETCQFQDYINMYYWILEFGIYLSGVFFALSVAGFLHASSGGPTINYYENDSMIGTGL